MRPDGKVHGVRLADRINTLSASNCSGAKGIARLTQNPLEICLLQIEKRTQIASIPETFVDAVPDVNN